MCKGKKKWFHILYNNKKAPPKDGAIYMMVFLLFKEVSLK